MIRHRLTSRVTFATLTLGILVFSEATAHARDWYILKGSTGTCGPSRQTPEQMHQSIRSDGETDSVDVIKNPSGEVLSVVISFSNKGTRSNLLYFPSAANCEIMRKHMMDNGEIAATNDIN